ncbi:hypothetical protein ONS95_009032 [Cadophora gregata]|uniref:uncharacterized protein n=1 Tax=Cadophora gregata TaxID=51156 RepID=UPI0026DB2537|nr:uncharacterized protein ONS95_009032 [Cadophora gregata]KAK0124046.1 hypothetical protein ONS95_009032 [Cadophora gregata]KAK0130379.1 hypothetical protein ONS96_000900 [Cadophora gregata f. sp. sojae]
MMASENQVMAAVLSQLSVTKLDFQRLADDIGLSNSEAARSRWRRLKAKLDESVAAVPESSPRKASVTSPSPRKEAPEKNGNGKRVRVPDIDDIEDDYHKDMVEKREGKVVGKEKVKRGRGKPRRAVVEKSKVLVPDDDYEGDEQEEEPIDDIVDDAILKTSSLRREL